MRERLLALAERRARLVACARGERESMAALLAPADGAASLAAALFQAARRAMNHAERRPLIVVAGVALLIALRPQRALIWLGRGWSLWRLYRGAHGWWLRFTAANASAGTPAGAARKSA